MVHDFVRESRDDEFEEKYRNSPLSSIDPEKQPPCSRDINTFSPEKFEIIHYDPLDQRNLPPAKEEIPPYSFCTSPYGRMFSDDPNRTWESDPKEQKKRLDNFWRGLREGKSLVFFYVNHGNPLEEDKSDRIIVGVGRISKIGNQLYFGKKKGYEDDYPVWSRCITHNFPEEGVRLPYQEYIDAGLDPKNIVCTVPISARNYFLYVAEHVPDDVAVAIIERVIQSVKRIIADNKIPEPYGKTWEYRLNWLNEVLAEVWKDRGLFPGIGGVLEYLGFENGVIFHKTVLSKLEGEKKNIFELIFSILDKKEKYWIIEDAIPAEDQKRYTRSIQQAIRVWNSFPESRKKLLKLLCRFELLPSQVERIAYLSKRERAGIYASDEELIENPYLISELDEGDENSPPVDFDVIDRGMLPSHLLDFDDEEIEIVHKNDHRRIRALFVKILKDAARDGDTCLSIDEVIRRIPNYLPEDRVPMVDKELILHSRSFYEKTISFFPEDSPKIVALKNVREMELRIKEQIEGLLDKEYPSPGKNYWLKLLEEELKDVEVVDYEHEQMARLEKAEALEKLFSSRFSVLVGRAGTGKTTVLKILLRAIRENEGRLPVLLLAPTGKARVRMQEVTGVESKTIHQFLMEHGWIDEKTYKFKREGDRKYSGGIIVIDEASMVPLDLLDTLFRAVHMDTIKRFILIGDPNQLPPIGLGRPFVDIVSWLDADERRRKRVAKLHQRVRQRTVESQILKLSDAFLGDITSPGDDEIISKIAIGGIFGDLEVYFWEDDVELFNLLNKLLMENLDLSHESDYVRFNKSLEKADSWQILSPTRLNFYGTAEINRIIQKAYRGRLIEYAMKNGPKPFGPQQIVQYDKVIQIVNSRRKCIKNGEIEGYVANGEVGIVLKTYKKRTWHYKGKTYKEPDRLDVRFSTQPKVVYRYRRNEVEENLELAYAITVHKAQGSEFDVVFLIIPQNARTMSRELLYTGLTRATRKLVLLIEKDVRPLIEFRKPQSSEVLRRNTNLFEPILRPEDIGVPHPERLIHVTKSGIRVRSKSEVIIANILEDLGLHYEYEKPLYAKNNPRDFRLPDFTIYYKGEEFYWEHLGMLNDPTYREEWERKKKWYESNGYADRLIVSRDKPDGGIDSQEIEDIAKRKILGL